MLSDDVHRARSLAIVAGGNSVALVAGLPFGILVGQEWGWRTAMWLLVALAALSTLAIGHIPPEFAEHGALFDLEMTHAFAGVRPAALTCGQPAG